MSGRTRPTFLVIGAAKAGTTTLCELLRRHPQVAFSSPKELHYFSSDEAYAKGPEWYASWFDDCGDATQVGEGSTTYTVRELFPHAAARIAADLPGVRMIFIARDPLDRIESLWLQLRQFFSGSPFARVGLEQVPEGLRVDASFDAAVRRQAPCLVDSTDYGRELEPYRRFVPDERLLVLLFEDLVARPAEVLARCFRFLELDPEAAPVDTALHLNPSSGRVMARDGLWRLWSSPAGRRAYDALAGLFPQRVRDAFAGVLTRRADARPTWDPQTRAWVLDRLGDDSARFLERFGHPADAWPSLR